MNPGKQVGAVWNPEVSECWFLEVFLKYELCSYSSFEPQLVKSFYFSVQAGKESILSNMAKSDGRC